MRFYYKMYKNRKYRNVLGKTNSTINENITAPDLPVINEDEIPEPPPLKVSSSLHNNNFQWFQRILMIFYIYLYFRGPKQQMVV